MVILAAPVTGIRWIGSVIGLDLVGEMEFHVPAGRLVMLLIMTTFGKFVSIILFVIVDIIGVILDGLFVVVRGLVCQLAEEVSRFWVHPSLLERRWRRGG
jgi:general stress protein CsbA